MQELEQIESTIQELQKWLSTPQEWFTTLENRHTALIVELEVITRPQPSISKVSMKKTGPGFEYKGQMLICQSYIDIYIDLLRRLWFDYPAHREAMAWAMSSRARKRTYVSQTRRDLFPGKPPEFAHKYSRKLMDNWYVDTNLSSDQMRTILPLAVVGAPGLSLGKDVSIYWK